MPFWHGDRPGRSAAFGRKIGALVREVAEGKAGPLELQRAHDVDARSADAMVMRARSGRRSGRGAE